MNQSDIDTIRATAHKFDAEKFYTILFTNHPDLRGAFPEDLSRQKVALTAALGRMIKQLDNPEPTKSYLNELGKRHVAYGATPDLYDIVGLNLIQSLELDNVDQVGSWLSLYLFISSHMLEGANAV